MNWQTVIGLEVHAQLSTHSKLFSNASTRYGALPNTQVNFIDAGFPGVLPVLNQQAVYMAVQFGLAIHATINNDSYFERKNYFYPDLPKGYQISQFQRPIIGPGHLDIMTSAGSSKIVWIDRAHLEEDAGKSTHDSHAHSTGIDLNRAGTPLLEIVTTPCLYSADETISYLKTLHQLLRFLGICDGNMQEGSFRCDVNLSLRPEGQEQLGTRTELKNINSFRFIEKAIQFEQLRHQELLETGQMIHQETRLYNPDKNQTELLRTKENENDYRYFPDPDLLPIHLNEDVLARLKATLPELPVALMKQLQQEDGLNDEQVDFILTSPAVVQFYRTVKQHCTASPKTILNWLKGQYAAALNERGLTFEQPPISALKLSHLLNRLHDNTLSNTTAKKLFTLLLTSTKEVDALIESEGLATQQNTADLELMIRQVVEQFPQQAADYRAGKDKLLGFFVGHVMKLTQGQADAAVVNDLLKQHLS
jgi:aspartyl-tRNA(Asn)/glutamyl-tRNA(Gln) amidotransferase subunit B